MTVVGVVALRWVARGARIGAPSVTLWLLAWLLFFLPLATAVSALSARHPEQGGIYVWTRRAFGPVHGFVCGWCLWINNLFYFPSLLLFGAANALLPFGARFQGLAESRPYSIAFVLLMLWLAVGLNLLGLSKAKWLQNVGSAGTWLPAALLIACGAVAVVWFGSATSFAPSALLPRGDLLGTLSLWSAICFAFSGFELTSLVGQEVRDPSRTIPAGILLAGGIVTLIYIAGSVSILVAVPASSLVERSGIADAVELVSARVGLGGAGALTGGLLALGAVAMTSAWFAGRPACRSPLALTARCLPRSRGSIRGARTPPCRTHRQGAVSALIFPGERPAHDRGQGFVDPGHLRRPGEPDDPALLRPISTCSRRSSAWARPLDQREEGRQGGRPRWLAGGCGAVRDRDIAGAVFAPPGTLA
jgi:amino acid transporter